MTRALIVWCGLLVPVAAAAQDSPSYDPRPKISVSGEAVVYVQPDKIIVSLGIETSDRDIELAKNKNTALLKKAVAAIKECGIEEKAIQTDRLSIEPRYRDSYRRDDFLGYFVQNGFAVTLTDVAKVEELITAVLKAGVTHIHGVDFQSTEMRKHRDRAREMALKAAREKAVDMAGVLGQHVGKPLQISEDQSYGGWWYSSGWRGGGRDYGMAQNSMQVVPGGGGGEIGDTLALGKIGIRGRVQVTFELKDK